MGDGSEPLTAESETSATPCEPAPATRAGTAQEQADDSQRPTPLIVGPADGAAEPLTASGRKALEYRIYWLERKLAHQKENKQRINNARRIARMAPSASKEMMHLNNEFQRANEESAHLHKLIQEINDESLRINLRSQQINQVVDEQIENTDRITAESLRLNAVSRKISRESMRTTRISRRVNKHAQKAIAENRSIGAESKQLNERLQTLQGRMEEQIDSSKALNEESGAALAAAARTNADLISTQSDSHKINQGSLQINDQVLEANSHFDQLTQESRRINGDSIDIQQTTRAALEECQEAVHKAEKAEERSAQTQRTGKRMLQTAESLNQRAEATNSDSERLQGELQDSLTRLQQDSTEALDSLRSNADERLSTIETLADSVHGDLSSSLSRSEEINQRSEQINEQLLQTNQQFDQLNQQSCRINQESLKSQQTAREAKKESLAAIDKPPRLRCMQMSWLATTSRCSGQPNRSTPTVSRSTRPQDSYKRICRGRCRRCAATPARSERLWRRTQRCCCSKWPAKLNRAKPEVCRQPSRRDRRSLSPITPTRKTCRTWSVPRRSTNTACRFRTSAKRASQWRPNNRKPQPLLTKNPSSSNTNPSGSTPSARASTRNRNRSTSGRWICSRNACGPTN